mmetsp:Transcript_21204/g.37781  ORF Transcript_21204/g.37781 Transcript_21204/m.37781 type:complete len:174 (-) Transcript_21204:97-618(-)
MVDPGRGCPYEVLGVKRTASKEEVKAAFRDQAMRCHPDREPSPQAVARFVEIRAAAEALLHGKPYSLQRPGGAAAGGTSNAAAAGASHTEAWVESVIRRRSFSSLFSGLCIMGGCALFAGVLYQHIYYPMYNARLYVPPDPSGTPKELTEQQARMNEMLHQKLEERRRAAEQK